MTPRREPLLLGRDLALNQSVEEGNRSESLESSAPSVDANEAIVGVERHPLAFSESERRGPGSERRIPVAVAHQLIEFGSPRGVDVRSDVERSSDLHRSL